MAVLLVVAPPVVLVLVMLIVLVGKSCAPRVAVNALKVFSWRRVCGCVVVSASLTAV